MGVMLSGFRDAAWTTVPGGLCKGGVTEPGTRVKAQPPVQMNLPLESIKATNSFLNDNVEPGLGHVRRTAAGISTEAGSRRGARPL